MSDRPQLTTGQTLVFAWMFATGALVVFTGWRAGLGLACALAAVLITATTVASKLRRPRPLPPPDPRGRP